MLRIRIVGLTRRFIAGSLRTSYTRQHFPATVIFFLFLDTEREMLSVSYFDFGLLLFLSFGLSLFFVFN